MKEIMLIGNVGDQESGFTASRLAMELGWAGGDDVRVIVYSFGGSLYEGLAMRNLVMAYPGNIEVRIVGIAASAASLFTTGFKKVVMYDTSYYMIHDGQMVVSGSAKQIAEAGTRMEALNESMAQAYAMKTGGKKSADEIRAMMKQETYMTAEEALAAGLVDEIASQEHEGEEQEDDDDDIIMANLDSLKAYASVIHDTVMAKSDIPLDVRLNFVKFGSQDYQPKKGNSMNKEILQALGLDAESTTASVVTKINELASAATQVTALREQLSQKAELVTSLTRDLSTVQAKVSELETANKASAITAFRHELCQELGVTMSAENVTALERRINTMFSIQDDSAKDDMKADIRMWVERHGVATEKIVKDGGVNRSNPEASAKKSDFESKVLARIEEIRAENKSIDFGSAYNQAVAEISASAQAGDEE